MNEKEFQQYHKKTTPTIKKALKIASHLFCITNYQETCRLPCNIHQQASILLPEIINRPNQSFFHTALLENNTPTNTSEPPNPPPNKCKNYKITPLLLSLTKKHSKRTDKVGTIQKFTSYKYKWMQPQIHLNKCNPDSDINTYEPTIQIIQDKALIFNNKGYHLITIPKNRLEWLWNQYNANSNKYHQLDPPCQPFVIEII